MANDVKITIKADNKASKDINQVGKDIEGLGDSTKGAGKQSSGFADNWSMMLLGINQGIQIIRMAGQAVEAAFDFTREGAQIIQTKDSFASLLSTIGEGPYVLDEWREAVDGTITDMELMAGFQTLAAGLSKEMTSAFADNNVQLLKIAKAASALNPALGDTAYMYESITRGIKRASPLILDNLGIVVKVGDANKRLADELGKTVDELTAEEKQMALLNEVLKSGDTLINQLGGSVESATDKWDKLTTAIKNNMNAVKESSAESTILNNVLEDATTGLDNASEMTRQHAIDHEILQIALEQELITWLQYKNISGKRARWNEDMANSLDYVTQMVRDNTMAFKENQNVQDDIASLEWLNNLNNDLDELLSSGYDSDMRALNDSTKGNASHLLSVAKASDMAAQAAANFYPYVTENAGYASDATYRATQETIAYAEELGKITSLDKNFSGIISYAKEYDDILEEITEQQRIMAEEPIGSEKYEEAAGKVAELQQAMTDMANQVVLDMFMATISIDTVTEAEAEAYFKMAEDMGIISGEAADEAMRVYGEAVDYVNGLEIEDKHAVYSYSTELHDPLGLKGWTPKNRSVTYTFNTVRTGDNVAMRDAAGGIVHAASGVSASAPYWVGELGPEPFFPSQDGRIVSNSEAKAAMRSGGGKTQPITVVINTPMNFADKVWVENELVPYIRDAMARAQL